MSDLIDRQVAIDKLQKEINKGIPPFDDVMGAIRCGVRLARNIIEDLPSAQPEIIRCKDCKYKNLSDICEYFEVSAGYYTVWHHVEDNDFCSRGERRSDV